jgi:membrane-associated phospholipid phosphatase
MALDTTIKNNFWHKLNSFMPRQLQLLPVEWLSIFYTLLTGIGIVIAHSVIGEWVEMTLYRILIIVLILLLAYVENRYKHGLINFIRISSPLLLLVIFYPETYQVNKYFPNLDHIFANLEQIIFHCQPAEIFSQTANSKVFNELINLGYFAFYPLIFITLLIIYLQKKELFNETIFVIMASFFLFYIIFMFLPVAGPQFYFPAIGQQALDSANFYPVGHYFQTHPNMEVSPIPDAYLFRELVKAAQLVGERPTGAFPSSHVGITVILLIILFKNSRRWFYYLLPVSILLFMATVYIKAHYVVDVIAGFIVSFLFFYLLTFLYKRLSKEQS